MKKNIIVFGFLCICCAIASAQNFGPNEVVGAWKVVETEITFPMTTDKSLAKQIAGVKEQFLHSVFVFHADNNFSLNINIDELKIQKAHWKYNQNNNRYEIQLWEDKDNSNSFLMVIEVKKEGVKTYIVILTDGDLPKEYSIKLEVVKMLE